MKRAPSCGHCGELTGRSRLASWEISMLLIPRATSSQASLQMGSLAPMPFNASRGILMFSRMCLSHDDAASKRGGLTPHPGPLTQSSWLIEMPITRPLWYLRVSVPVPPGGKRSLLCFLTLGNNKTEPGSAFCCCPWFPAPPPPCIQQSRAPWEEAHPLPGQRHAQERSFSVWKNVNLTL